MTQRNIKNFINETYSKSPKRNYATNKTDVYYIDEIWSLDILDLKDYGPENNRGYRFVLLIRDSFSKFGWTVPMKNKNAQTIKDSFENILKVQNENQIKSKVIVVKKIITIFFKTF